MSCYVEMARCYLAKAEGGRLGRRRETTVAIDLDWTLANLKEYYIQKFYEKYGFKLAPEESGITLKYLISDRDVDDIVSRAWFEWGDKVELMDERWPEALRKMSRMGVRIVLLTARGSDEMEPIMKWMRKADIIWYFSDFFFVGDPKEKSKVRFDVLIDDEFLNCLDAANSGSRAIWFDPWLEVEGARGARGIYFARNVEEILEILGRILGW